MREDELRQELSLWKTKYEQTTSQLEETNNKIDEYKTILENNQEASQLLDKEIQESKLAIGQTDVEGEGIVITYIDGEKRIKASDLLALVNELNSAEAEAISINGQRIVATTDITDVDPYIYINGGERITSPYTIKAIGNKKYLEGALTLKGGIVATENDKGKIISVESRNNVQIPKYAGELKTNNINLK